MIVLLLLQAISQSGIALSISYSAIASQLHILHMLGISSYYLVVVLLMQLLRVGTPRVPGGRAVPPQPVPAPVCAVETLLPSALEMSSPPHCETEEK